MPNPRNTKAPLVAKNKARVSPALSLPAPPGPSSIEAKKVALLIAGGFEFASAQALIDSLQYLGANVRVLGPRVAEFESTSTDRLEAVGSLESDPSAMFDGLVIADGAASLATLARNGRALEFVWDQYQDRKSIFCLGAASSLLAAAGVDIGRADAGILDDRDVRKGASGFVKALAQHRHFARRVDPRSI